MALEFTAVFRPVPEGYVAFVEELPGANTQGATLDEARARLEDVVHLVLEANRTLAQEDLAGAEAIREPRSQERPKDDRITVAPVPTDGTGYPKDRAARDSPRRSDP
jgi:predicted RNase H-like HicB family nuclease